MGTICCGKLACSTTFVLDSLVNIPHLGSALFEVAAGLLAHKPINCWHESFLRQLTVQLRVRFHKQVCLVHFCGCQQQWVYSLSCSVSASEVVYRSLSCTSLLRAGHVILESNSLSGGATYHEYDTCFPRTLNAVFLQNLSQKSLAGCLMYSTKTQQNICLHV